MMHIFVLIVLGLAAYRVTRFLIIDSFFEGTRNNLQTWLANKRGTLAAKLLDLISCTWCAGFWVSMVIYSLFLWQCPIWFSRLEWINLFAIAGVQGFLHALEPNED